MTRAEVASPTAAFLYEVGSGPPDAGIRAGAVEGVVDGEDGRDRWSAVALFTAVVVAGTAGFGFAMWSASGIGSGQAKATTAVALTLSAGTASAQLYPGWSGDVCSA